MPPRLSITYHVSSVPAFTRMARQFTIKRLFASTAIAAVGMAMLVWARVYRQYLDVASALIIVVAAGACLGAAVLTPFKHPLIGAAVGALATIVFLSLTAELNFR